MKRIYSISLYAFAILATVSCDKKTNAPLDKPEVTVGTYILNSGQHDQNNASLTYYDLETGATTQSVFEAVNGKGLGNTAQDMIIYGGKIYIVVHGSGLIFVTDKTGEILEEIVSADYLEPRYLTAYNGKVYASYWDQGIVEIDTTTFATNSAPLRLNAEELVVANDKIYVAISGKSNDSTVVVVNPTTLETIKTIDVVLNPNHIEADNAGSVYVLSWGKSWVEPQINPVLQKINSTTDAVTVITLPEGAGNPLRISMGAENKLFVLAGKNDATTEYKAIGKIYVYNTLTQSFEGEFITEGTTPDAIYSISADPISGDVYLGTSDDYSAPGNMYIYGANGVRKAKITTGVSPIAAEFVSTK